MSANMRFANGRTEGCRDAMAANCFTRLLVLKALDKSWEYTVLAGFQQRSALMVWPMLSALPRMPTPNCSGASDDSTGGIILT
jgi:hypothetical protein